MGFPDDVSVALQQLLHIERMDVSKLLPTARLLVSKRIKKTEMVAASAQSYALRNKAQKELSSLQCFRCRGPHYIKDCMEIPRAKVICYNYGKFGHMARYCTQIQGNGQGGSFCDSSYPGNRLKAQYWPLPIIEVVVDNTVMTALVDTGCTTTLINSRLMSGCSTCGTVKVVDGRDIKCKGARQVEIKVHGVRVKMESDINESHH